MFPGLCYELAAHGAVRFDTCADVRSFHHGVWKRRLKSGIPMRAQSRLASAADPWSA